MHTLEITVLEPKAEVMLDEMENENLIKIEKSDADDRAEKLPLERGCMKGFLLYMADDFDAPLEDFEEYM